MSCFAEEVPGRLWLRHGGDGADAHGAGGVFDPVVREESHRTSSPTASREEEPSNRPKPIELVNSLTILPEVGVSKESAPRGSMSEMTPLTETAMSLPLEPSFETQHAEEDIS